MDDPEYLLPNLETLREEYVLVQAFKKTVSYIRGHNWFADVLELDLATVDYPRFLRDLQSALEKPERWQSMPLRLVPAPKSQPWSISKDQIWEPRRRQNNKQVTAKLRPLAHVPLRDQ